MAILTREEIAGAARIGGWPVELIPRAVAHAWCESSGNTEAKNDVGAGHTGLWQISGLHGVPRDELYNPLRNAQVAYDVYKRQGWGAWAETAGCAAAGLGAATRAAAEWEMPPTGNSGGLDGIGQVGLDGIGQVVTNPIDSAKAGIEAALAPVESLASGVRDAVEVVIAAGQWLANSHNLARVALVALGGTVAVVAVGIVIRPYTEKRLAQVAAIKGSTT